MPYWEINHETWSIDTLRNHMVQKTVDLNPVYQRDLVWDRATKKRLIWCILQQQDIPKFYVHKIVGRRGAVKYAVIDGKQRMATIMEFISGHFALSITASPVGDEVVARKTFSQLSEMMRRRLGGYTLDVTSIDTDDAERVIEQFIDLQRGKSLNPQEKREATPSAFNIAVRSLQSHALFSVIRTPTGSSKRQWLARCFSYQLTPKHGAFDPDILTRLYLRSAIGQLPDASVATATVAVTKILDTLALLFADEDIPAPRNVEGLTLMMFVDGLDNVDLRQREATALFRRWWCQFWQEELSKPHGPSIWTSKGTHGIYMEMRHKIMANSFARYYPQE